MSQGKSLAVVQLGPEGLVAERFREIVAQPGSPFTLEAVATSDPKLIRSKFLGETTLRAPDHLSYVPVINLESVYNTDAPVLVSHLDEGEALEYEVPLADDRSLMVTTGAANSERSDVALFNAYVGGGQLEELYAELRQGNILATGSPIAIPIGIVTAPLHAAIGIKSMNLETLQGWSDEDKTRIPEGYEKDISERPAEEWEKAQADIRKLLGTMEEPASIRIGGKLNRGPWVEGHHAWLKLHFARPTSEAEIKELMEAMRAPEELRNMEYGDASPRRRPIKVARKPLKKPDKAHIFKLARTRPMKVKARVADVAEDGQSATIELIADSLMLGSAGSAAMDIGYAQAIELI